MTGLIPWSQFRGPRRRDDLLDDFFREFFRTGEEGGLMEPAAEVAESNGDVTVKMQIPGVPKDRLNISVAEDHLTVRGEVKKEEEEKKRNFYRQEIRYGAFERTVALPAEVNADKAKAELKDGILRITLPKADRPKARRIDVSVS